MKVSDNGLMRKVKKFNMFIKLIHFECHFLDNDRSFFIHGKYDKTKSKWFWVTKNGAMLLDHSWGGISNRRTK